jgi:tRNA A-37 threonylcarbamoyl transferase component Bud32
MTYSSAPIESKSYVLSNKSAEEIIPLGAKGATSYSYLVRIEGKEHFMKQLRPELKDDWRYRSAYQKEYEVGRSIASEYIVRYEAIDENAEGLYILMEHVNGHTLDEKLASEPEYFSHGRNYEKLFIQLLRGLKALHEAHVAYLDLKPENVMLTQVNGDVKIIDLGFCFADAYSHTAGTTLHFAAPELQRGDSREVDERTDIYAVGCLMQYVKEAACVDVPKRLQRIIDRCTRPTKQDRYANVEEVIRAVMQKRRWTRRLGIAMVLFLVIGIGVDRFAKSNYFTTVNLHLMWLLKKTPHDVMWGYNYYRILSEDSLTCEVVGGRRLKNIYIAEKVIFNDKEYRTVSVAEDAFGGRRIQSVYIPEGVKEIGANAFDRCVKLVSLHLPASVEKIGVSSFESLKELRSLQLSENIKEIPMKAFVSCGNLKKLVIPEGVEELGLDCFAICTGLEEVTLPSTLTTIKRGVFWHCTSLKEISIPASVETIGEYVLHDCWSLTDVYNYAPVPQRIPPIFNKRGITLHVPRGSKELYRQADNWNLAEVVGDL